MKSFRNTISNTELNKINEFINNHFPDETRRRKEDLELRLALKGVYIYERIHKYLKSFKDTITLDQVESVFVYDKRIRKILYKFTGMIEERYRAILYNTRDESEYSSIESTTFGKLINEKFKEDEITNTKKKKLKKIILLRNNLSHHKLLLIDDDGNKNVDTIESIKILKSFLPTEDIKNQFINDLEKAYEREIDDEKYNNDIEWVVPKELKIKL